MSKDSDRPTLVRLAEDLTAWMQSVQTGARAQFLALMNKMRMGGYLVASLDEIVLRLHYDYTSLAAPSLQTVTLSTYRRYFAGLGFAEADYLPAIERMIAQGLISWGPSADGAKPTATVWADHDLTLTEALERISFVS